MSRATRESQHLFVNRRPVDNRSLNFALSEGYHTALMKGRYPVCCLFLELDPAGVDVNVHPAKREVKFHQEREVRRLVTQAVRDTLLQYHSRSGMGGQVASAPSVKPDGEARPGGERSSALTVKPPTGQEMSLAKASLTRGYPRNFETVRQVARAASQLELYGLPDTYFETFIPAVHAVAAADVTRAALGAPEVG